jgi:hypothetical protein
MLLAFNTFGHQPLAVDESSCRAVKRAVPLSGKGLPAASTFNVGYVHFTARCLLGGRLLVRVRVHTDGSGRPLSALMALRMEKRNRAVSFIRWSPKRVVASLTSRCS